MALKVVIIGGGSSYTPEIMEGFLKRYEQFPVTDIVLVDVKAGEEKVKIVTALAKRMVLKAGKDIRVSYTFNRKEALQGADFVTTQIRVGGLQARAYDERIPLKHGMIGQETNGAGGIMKAFRTIPVMLEIAQEMHEICPDAWLINFTNPAGIVTEAVMNHSPFKNVIGVCNIPFNMRSGVGELFQVPAERVMIEFVGLNHFVFGRKVYIDGVDRTAEAMHHLIYDDVDYSPANIVALPWNKQFLKTLNMLPNPYHQYYFQHEQVLKKDVEAYQTNVTRAEVVMEVEEALFKKYQSPNLDVKPEELEQRGGAYYSEAACNVMTSIYNNSMDVQTVNTLNNGTITDLPADCVIEVNSVITASGPMPLSIGNLPAVISGAIVQMKQYERLVVEAAVTGDYSKAYAAMIMNPLVTSDDKAQVVLDELLHVHQSNLPQFSKEVVKQ
ncbi:6-phospho-beta-glucosidase [Pontibacillus litoralis]|uniref:Diacetylchitobiose-6-phosphate hydrolase n=1 Tax=Pontibacillus litoralis JSM 072002 TaxID=1385512 RepID=A0A0A5HTA4_9BACI|nr:6-phospho-beta-glucosidase [Pontibacillus litoralis]KGX86862.1 diacetylchitobiose-6-phosphate hydrolase [Pontibacillus litoralis JSM 072002]